MDSSGKTANQLIDKLTYHWRWWTVNCGYYVTQHMPKLIADPSKGNDIERNLLPRLRALLNEEEWAGLPQILAERCQGIRREFESERLLREAQALERIRKGQPEELRANAREHLRQSFHEDFLQADILFAESYFDVFTEAEYQTLKVAFVRRWLTDNLPEVGGKRQMPDDEQLAAIAAVNGHVQVIARAGSGKTATLVNRTYFMIRHCKVAPSAILILAFNRKAAQEIRKRLGDMLQVESESVNSVGALPHVMTFHALAYAIVHPEETLLYDDSQSDAKQLSRAFQQVIDDHIRDPKYEPLVRELMLLRWRTDWERIEEGGHARNKEDFLRYRRSLARRSIDGRYVKSFGEKAIANFLFEHGIQYRYEQNHWWDGKNYRPDFTIPVAANKGIVIEYFGLTGDPDYDEMSQRKRMYWNTKPDWQFLEYMPTDIAASGVETFRERLECDLRARGVIPVALSEDEIWRRVRERAIDDFTKASRTFVERCRQQSLSPQTLRNLINSHQSISEVETKFLKLAWILYSAYLERLAFAGEEDFSGLLQRSAKSVNQGTARFWRKGRIGNLRDLRYVCIDEFQDFSELFYRLLAAIQEVNPGIELFCVGDDWQAINGFAGSDLKFFEKFEEHFGSVTKLYLSTNYRSSPEIVSLGNALMAGRGQAAAGANQNRGRIFVADLSKFDPGPAEREQFKGDVITPSASRLVAHSIACGGDIALLSRRNGLPYYLNIPGDWSRQAVQLQDWAGFLKSRLPEEQRNSVSISTAHKFKGLEQSTVVVLDACERSYPLIHPDWVFSRILGDSMEKIIDAERRLFYVAISRAIDTLVICTDGQNRSPFLEEIERRYRLDAIDWSAFPMIYDSSARLEVRVMNQTRTPAGAGTRAVKDLLKAYRYQWSSTSYYWAKSWQAEGFTIDLLREEIWTEAAAWVEVQVFRSGELGAVYWKTDTEWHCKFDNLQSDGKGENQ